MHTQPSCRGNLVECPRVGQFLKTRIMKPQKEVRISNWAAHMTTGVSVTLALLTLGIIALIWIAATSESRRMMEKIEISVIMTDSVSENRAMEICKAIEQQPFVLHAVYISKSRLSRTGKRLPERILNALSASIPCRPRWLSPSRGNTLPRRLSQKSRARCCKSTESRRSLLLTMK